MDAPAGPEATEVVTPAEPAPAFERRPWTTGIACAIMVLLFLGVQLDGSREALLHWGYRDAYRVWDGAHWALISTAFLHQAWWHIAFNLYWTWVLGRAIERVIGPFKLAAFLLVSAYVASAVQLGMAQHMGIGASGMAYALFGFGWAARQRFPSLQTVFTNRNNAAFFGWFILCWLVFRGRVGNEAHLGGLLFGVLTAEALVTGRRPRLARIGACLLVFATVTMSFVCPWSARWWAVFGNWMYTGKQYSAAADSYEESLRRDPHQAWLLENLVYAQRAAGDEAAAQSALNRLRALDAKAADKLPSLAPAARDGGTQ